MKERGWRVSMRERMDSAFERERAVSMRERG